MIISFEFRSMNYNLQIIINMVCHFSCATCTLNSTAFNSCLTCPSYSKLSNGACFCNAEWSSNCTYTTSLQQFYVSLKSFYLLLAIMVMLLQYIRVKLPYSYRIVAGMQGFGLLVFSSQLFLYYENEYGLKILVFSNGFYNFATRMDSFSFYHGMGPAALFICFLIAYFAMYVPSKVFCKKYESYKEYLIQNFWNFMYTFYYYSSRNMFFFIGLWVNSMSLEISLIVPFSIFAVIILVVLVKFIYDYHKNKFEENCIYQPQLYLYAMLSGVPMVGLPFVKSSLYYVIVYLVQIGLLILLVILNRNYQVITKPKVLFYVMELLISGLIVAFIMLPDPYNSFILLGTICLASLGMVIQLAVVYYSGVDLARSNKIVPQSGQSQPINSINDINSVSDNPRKTMKMSTTKKNYF